MGTRGAKWHDKRLDPWSDHGLKRRAQKVVNDLTANRDLRSNLNTVTEYRQRSLLDVIGHNVIATAIMA
jgi:hypothetical protein